jgi:uncharacterized protein YndB with AHSA1/START domain
MIETSRVVHAPPAVVHDLLTDVAAWRVWAPHVRDPRPARGHVSAGQTVSVRAFFSPAPTPMHVTSVEPAGGMTWESRAAGHVLRYAQRVRPAPQGSRVTFTAEVEGPAGALLTALARPLSALGQRRRLARLAALAEWRAQGAPQRSPGTTSPLS